MEKGPIIDSADENLVKPHSDIPQSELEQQGIVQAASEPESYQPLILPDGILDAVSEKLKNVF